MLENFCFDSAQNRLSKPHTNLVFGALRKLSDHITKSTNIAYFGSPRFEAISTNFREMPRERLREKEIGQRWAPPLGLGHFLATASSLIAYIPKGMLVLRSSLRTKIAPAKVRSICALGNKSEKVVAIVGQTASGKSAVALELAKKIKGEIVNADSRQIYSDLSIGTAQPTIENRKLVPHHLYGFLNPKESYNAGRYSQEAREIIREILARKQVPIIVGGTALYIRALFHGLAPLPQRNDALRAELFQMAQENGRESLHRRLAAIDPISAKKIPYQNIQRVMRALEVYFLTGKTLSHWHTKSPKEPTHFQPIFFGLLWEKEKLRKLIFKRTEKILPGIILETDQLLKRGLKPSDPVMKSLGYRNAVQFIQKKISYQDLFQSLLNDTLHYAKRQMTWFKREDKIQWVHIEEPFRPEKVAEQIVLKLSGIRGIGG